MAENINASPFNLTGLPIEIQTHIFNMLNTDDLLSLCRTSQNFNEIVVKNVIPRKLIDFAAYKSSNVMFIYFNLFGKNMRRVSVANEPFDQFLLTLMAYGRRELLTELHYKLPYNNTVTEQLIYDTIPFFKNLTVLKLFAMDGKSFAINKWLATIPSNKIQSLELNGIHLDANEFKLDADNFNNLKHLKVHQPLWPNDRTVASSVTLLTYILAKPSLKSFLYRGPYIDMLFETIADNIPAIESVGAIDVAPVPLALNGDRRIVRRTVNWSFLSKFQRLRCISFQTGWYNFIEMNQIFQALSTRNSFEKLILYFENNRYYPVGDAIYTELNNFIAANIYGEKQHLECLELHSSYFSPEWRQYLHYLLTDVFVFKTCIISSNGNVVQSTINTVVSRCTRLENLVVKSCICISLKFYIQLCRRHCKVNQLSRVQKKLTIYIEDEFAEAIKNELGDAYQSNEIIIAPLSAYILN